MKRSASYRRSKNTGYKQASFRLAVGLHIDIVQAIQRDWYKPKPYLYFDLYGGPGIDPDGNSGSPVIFHQLATERDLNYRALVYEKNPTTYSSLVANTAAMPNMQVVNESHDEIERRLKSRCDWCMGLVYCDPSNAEIPVTPLFAIKQACPRVDFMINLAAASYKRTINLPSYRELGDILESLKKTWVVRKPVDKFQWTILVGSDHPDYPSWSNAGFERFDSPTGQDWYDRITHTKQQIRAANQPELFGEDVKKKPTQLTPSI